MANKVMMPKFDQNLQKALKSAAVHDGTPGSRERSLELLNKALEETRDGAIVKAARAAHEYLLTRKRRRDVGQPLEIPFDSLGILNTGNLQKTVELAFCELLGDAGAIPPEDFLKMNPPAKAIDLWLKTVSGKGSKDSPQEVARSGLYNAVEDDPKTALSCGLAAWFVENVPLESLLKTLPLFQEAKTNQKKDGQRNLLRTALARDRSGAFLLRYVGEVATNAESLREMAETIRTDPKTLDKVLGLLPQVLLGDEDGRLGEMVPMLFNDLPSSGGPHRSTGCGKVISLFGELLKDPARSSGKDAALDGLAALFDALEAQNSTVTDEGEAPFWVVRKTVRMKPVEPESAPSLNYEQAKLIGGTIERLRGHPNAIGVIEAMAANLGLEYFGKKDEEVKFDPVVHEDTVGGMLPGDRALVVRSGWMLGDQVILRATVD